MQSLLLPQMPRGHFAFEMTVPAPTSTQFPDRVVPMRYALKIYMTTLMP